MKFIILTTLVFQIVLNVTDLLKVSIVKPLNNGDHRIFLLFGGACYSGVKAYKYTAVDDRKN